jgi:NADPH:quinone reductase-like Zn-dependent oxidoreductase
LLISVFGAAPRRKMRKFRWGRAFKEIRYGYRFDVVFDHQGGHRSRDTRAAVADSQSAGLSP